MQMRNEIYNKIAGYNSLSADAVPLDESPVLKLASATKLITSIALLQCIEKGLITLDSPLTEILPEFADIQILTDVSGSDFTFKPSKTAITARHLLAHTSGLGYPFTNRLLGLRAQARKTLKPSLRVTEKYRYPLVFEPGTGWLYGCSLDWAGVVVSRLHDGISLEEYMIDNIWKKVGLSAPFPRFNISTHREYNARIMHGAVQTSDGRLEPCDSWAFDNPEDQEGGSGLSSTAKDYLAVLADLISESPKLLKPETITEMFTPQLVPGSASVEMLLELRAAWGTVAGPVADDAVNHGLGGVLFTGPVAEIGQPANVLAWGGATNIVWWVSRELGVAGFFATQQAPFGNPTSQNRITTGYAALIALSIGSAYATVFDIPGVLPAIPAVAPFEAIDMAQYFKRNPGDFVHPGIWHTHEDLERMRDNVLRNKEPWASAYQHFCVDQYSVANYTMEGPAAVISRGKISNYTSFAHDARAAWQNALMWYITRDQSHWDRSTSILDAWGSNLTDIVGIDRSLLIGLDGDLFVNAAEIMRWEGNWTESGSKWQGGSGFSNQLYWLFSRQSAAIGQANYGMASIKALMSFAVYLDDVQLYNYAVHAFIHDRCAGLLAMADMLTASGHTMSGIGWTAYGARVGQSQGSDLYSLGDGLLLRAAEYVAKYNLNHTVFYDPQWYRCEAVLVNGPWTNISEANRGVTNKNPMWDILFYEYVVTRGNDGPWTTAAKEAQGFAGGVSSNDHPSWGDLIWAR
ncbi:unnamed protein product [Aspergillus oryzae]|uniref:Unnamed protein product n=1 Tax=Aspergillus oryzae TaxID=5062 RepID=A0AAN4YMY1_ASPOZ|nr:unnamed protein product [Aspergillus oryzae]